MKELDKPAERINLCNVIEANTPIYACRKMFMAYQQPDSKDSLARDLLQMVLGLASCSH